MRRVRRRANAEPARESCERWKGAGSNLFFTASLSSGSGMLLSTPSRYHLARELHRTPGGQTCSQNIARGQSRTSTPIRPSAHPATAVAYGYTSQCCSFASNSDGSRTMYLVRALRCRWTCDTRETCSWQPRPPLPLLQPLRPCCHCWFRDQFFCGH